MAGAVLIVIVIAASFFMASTVSAAGEPCMKFSFDTLPFLGSSDKESEADEVAEEVDDRPASERYTYDATGRRVPVRTE